MAYLAAYLNYICIGSINILPAASVCESSFKTDVITWLVLRLLINQYAVHGKQNPGFSVLPSF